LYCLAVEMILACVPLLLTGRNKGRVISVDISLQCHDPWV